MANIMASCRLRLAALAMHAGEQAEHGAARLTRTTSWGERRPVPWGRNCWKAASISASLGIWRAFCFPPVLPRGCRLATHTHASCLQAQWRMNSGQALATTAQLCIITWAERSAVEAGSCSYSSCLPYLHGCS